MAALGGCTKDGDVIDVDLTAQLPDAPVYATMKVLSYNILEGMKLDLSEGKADFAAWVDAQSPDVFVIQEANGYNTASLTTLAAHWGHEYAMVGKDASYPVAVTSRYPITVVRDEKETLTHRLLHVRINGYDMVDLHLNPFENSIRVPQLEDVLDRTVRAYPDVDKWMIMGDFNAISPLDANDVPILTDYNVHNIMLAEGLVDVQRYRYNYFISTCPTPGLSAATTIPRRYDFIYLSPAIVQYVSDVEVIKDDFTTNMSDHYPVTVSLTAPVQ